MDSQILKIAGEQTRKKLEPMKKALFSKPFVREDRYIVLKKSDIDATLSKLGKESLQDICDMIHNHRVMKNKEPLKCVVVENDWPEYEKVWNMIKQRVITDAV